MFFCMDLNCLQIVIILHSCSISSKHRAVVIIFHLLHSFFNYSMAILLYFSGNRNGQYVWEDHRPRSGVWKGSNGGEIISFSGCDDDQTSADTSVSFMKPDLTSILHILI